jgi:acyl transferase domain-containing protein/acyl-CoA synthetase (AMP-forming)/AMP-acid ligase II
MPDRTLIELLERRAAKGLGAYIFLADGKAPVHRLTYADLAREAKAIALRLRERCPPGSRALLLFPPGPTFLPAFFGCLYAGVVAIPVPLPDAARLKRTLPRLQAVTDDAGAALVLTNAATADAFGGGRGDVLPKLPWLITDRPEGAASESALPLAPVDSAQVAYLQYTSGSTSTPRGVMLTHANVLANLRQLKRALGYDANSISVTWMPHFHDFGLVEGLLSPLFNDVPCHVLSPLAVLKRPLVWLQAIDRFRATHSHGPNFAYEMCLDRISAEQRRGLDLSSWRVAANGAEPVRFDTLARFTETFAPQGFNPATFSPAYGLAESVLLVTIDCRQVPPEALRLDAAALDHHRVEMAGAEAGAVTVRSLVHCGELHDAVRVEIVDPATRRPCSADGIGEIWLAGPSIAIGYWGKPDDTAAVFGARLASAPDEGPFLRTGDLGFVRDGGLYVTGRLKELIIIAGVNHYPQDIEWTVQSQCPEVRRDCCVAFSIEGRDTEQLVVVAEPDRPRDDWTPVFERMREAIAAAHGVVPAVIVLAPRGAVPKTSSGKLQRAACRKSFLDGQLPALATLDSRPTTQVAATPVSPASSDVEQWLCERLAAAVRVTPSEIDLHTPFAVFGIDSRRALALLGEIESRWPGIEAEQTLLWRFPTVAALSRYLSGGRDVTAVTRSSTRGAVPADEPIAVTGVACRFPGADDPDAFWSLVSEGRSAIGPGRLSGVEAGYLSGIDRFDAGLFGLPANEAQSMDPQQRLLLEIAWEALERAGVSPAANRPRAGGVFVGISAPDYATQRYGRGDLDAIDAHTGTGTAFSIAANRLSYQLNLSGPSMAIDTACSSSLVAVHQACRSLRDRECTFALAGGISLILSPAIHLALERAGMLSPSQRCQTFDAAADGYARGEGCGMVVLERLEDAQRNGSPILAVIRGSSINQDARSNGLTAPSPAAQQALMVDALARAGLRPGSVEYVEAHGTGTRLGDPIEVAALQAVYGEERDATERCWFGSVKANIGHLEAAAGIAGLIKVVLALSRGAIPPHANLRTINPLIRLDGTPFGIPTDTKAWQTTPRRAGVSAFGFGGSNAHVVVEEAPVEGPAATSDAPERPVHCLALSARSPETLDALAASVAALIRRQPALSLPDLCHTLGTGRAHLPERLALPVSSANQLAGELGRLAGGATPRGGARGHAAARPPEVVFLFTGQGSHYPGMAQQLYRTSPIVREVLDQCDALLRAHLEEPLLEVLYGSKQALLEQASYTQPALFAVEYALARAWQQWGILPAAVIGHSLGEFVAACVAGVMDLPDALRLVAARGAAMQALAHDGAMLAVSASEAGVREAVASCEGRVAIGAVNAPNRVVLSGARVDLERLERGFTAKKVTCGFLQVSHAFHSPLMEPALASFRAVAETVRYAPPRIPLVSNLDGRVRDAAPDADYWVRHARETVRFADGIQALAARHSVFLEIGPAPVLSALGAESSGNGERHWLPSLRPKKGDWETIVAVMSQLFALGVTPDFDAFDRGHRRARIGGLPTYPFDRQLFALPALERATLGETSDVRDWGMTVRWVPEPLREGITLLASKPPSPQAPKPSSATRWLVLGDGGGIGEALRRLLPGANDSAGIDDLPADLPHTRLRVVCLWALDWPAEPSRAGLEAISNRMLAMLQRLAGHRESGVWLVTRNAGIGPAGAAPHGDIVQSLQWGLGRSVAEEFPDFTVGLIDIDGDGERGAAQLLRETLAGDPTTGVCWRGEQRYLSKLEPIALEPGEDPALGGTWLVTGGLGELGLLTADWLIDRGVRHLVLLGRRHPSSATAALERFRERGALLQVEQADVADKAAITRITHALPSGWPPLEGVVHAAGVVDDGILHRQTGARFAAVLSPKVLGAWNLHHATLDLPLRHFILFSSVASLFGSAGQTAYAAGNAFLDSLAHVRHAAGLPATAINWSAWSGRAADPAVARQLARRGLRPIPVTGGMTALPRALSLGVPQVAILPRTSAAPDVMPAVRAREPALARLLESLPGGERVPALARHIVESLAAILGRPAEELDPARGFFDQGVDSLTVVELRNRLQRDLQQPMPVTVAFDFPTAASLAARLLGESPQLGADQAKPAASTGQIAVVSMACRMPGHVDSPEALWQLLRDGGDAIVEVPSNRWDAAAHYHPDPDHPGTITTRYGGFVDAVYEFDAQFFGISPTEARHLDPQQRLLLEVCWETLERAGIAPARLAGTPTGVFIGISTNDYVQRLNRRAESVDAYVASGNALSLAANRLSYVFGFEGPSIAVDTACSSSLVAIHQACQSLRAGESDAAIAGGVNLLLDPTVSINHSRARLLSPDGRCKAFSRDADGMSRSEGCGLVLLKRLEDAVRDGDPIIAVIRGSAVNQDGRTSGLTVPNGRAQQRVIHAALSRAGVEPGAIDYVEAHGTGTPLGDPIEAAALADVFQRKQRPLTIGSIKTNVGHLESAAGVAGLMKAILSLQHEEIPRQLHGDALNPQIDWAANGLRVSTTAAAWPRREQPRLAGVSSFGFGGTNSHVIVEESPAAAARELPALAEYLLPLSARSASALRQLATDFVDYLEATDAHAADICFTASIGRDHFAHRLAIAGDSVAGLRQGLQAWLEGSQPPTARSTGVTAIAGDYLAGRDSDWRAIYAGVDCRRVVVPGHPFERQTFVVNATVVAADKITEPARQYGIEWTAQAWPLPAGPAGHWLIYADVGGWAEMVAREIRQRGGTLSSGDDLDAVRGVLDLRHLDAPRSEALETESLLDVQRGVLEPIMQLERRLRALPAVRLWIGTQDAQAVRPGDRLEGLAQATVWGLGRSIALERHGWSGLVDLPAGGPSLERVEHLCDLILADPAETQWAIRDGRHFAPRLKPVALAESPSHPITADASYLVTGSFGSVGKAMARWLADEGARSLWLIGRHGDTAAGGRDFVNELEARGVRTRVAALDASDEAALTACLAAWQREGPPLRGIVHAAGTNSERSLADTDWHSVAGVLTGKAGGAWALHRATAGMRLDFFVVCSSIAGSWGGIRQSAYSAANAFLDGLAAHRQASGLSGLSVAWGPLSGSAMLHPDAAAALREVGIQATPLGACATPLGPMLSAGRTHLVSAAIDWHRFVPFYTSRNTTGLFDDLLERRDEARAHAHSPEAVRQALVVGLSRILGLPEDQIDPDVPLPRLGLDSLMAVALRDHMARVCAVDLVLGDLLGTVTLNALAGQLAAGPRPEPLAEQAWVTGEI